LRNSGNRRFDKRPAKAGRRGRNHMQVFGIRYRNTQGTLMRILNAVSRRGIDMPYVQATPAEHSHTVTLLLEVNPKQMGQLRRDWYAIVDVTEVHVGGRLTTMPAKPAPNWTAPAYPPISSSVGGDAARTASA
jgi:acetolactate synthase regulatory subunit